MKAEKFSEKRRFGNLGEEIACKYLKKKGFYIITQNYLKKWGEIDIVAKKGSVLHFAEVKTVSWETSIRPEENIHPQKLKRLYRTIETYLLEKENSHGIGESEWVLDIVCVFLDIQNKRARVRFLENVVG